MTPNATTAPASPALTRVGLPSLLLALPALLLLIGAKRCGVCANA
jgi:hypothetical protein